MLRRAAPIAVSALVLVILVAPALGAAPPKKGGKLTLELQGD